jgi:hypothetical protein
MYKTINGWTKEKMKEQIRKKNNGSRAWEEGKIGYMSGCRYRTPDNNHCAVGCFIPENHEALQYVGDSNWLLNHYPGLEFDMPLNKEALFTMQQIHDEAIGVNVQEILCKWIDQNVVDA